MAEESGTGLRCPVGAGVPGDGLGVADGLIAGNRPAALPAPEVHTALPSPAAGEPATVGAEADTKHDSKPA